MRTTALIALILGGVLTSGYAVAAGGRMDAGQAGSATVLVAEADAGPYWLADARSRKERGSGGGGKESAGSGSHERPLPYGSGYEARKERGRPPPRDSGGGERPEPRDGRR